MKNHILKAVITIAVCALFTGCATTKNLMGANGYIKETVPNQHTSFRQIWATEEGGKFKVSGRLHLERATSAQIHNYVEVSLLDKNRQVIETQKVPYLPKVMTRRKLHKEARFSAHFSETPPPGSTILLNALN